MELSSRTVRVPIRCYRMYFPNRTGEGQADSPILSVSVLFYNYKSWHILNNRANDDTGNKNCKNQSFYKTNDSPPKLLSHFYKIKLPKNQAVSSKKDFLTCISGASVRELQFICDQSSQHDKIFNLLRLLFQMAVTKILIQNKIKLTI